MANLLYVCQENWARSPAAEQMTKARLNDASLHVSSAGITVIGRYGMPNEMAFALKRMNYEPLQQTPAIITPELLLRQDIILCMESGQVAAVRSMGAKRVHTLREFAGLPGNIPDPSDFIGRFPDFDKIRDMPYDVRRAVYRLWHGVDRRDEVAVLDLHMGIAHNIETCVNLALEKLEKEGVVSGVQKKQPSYFQIRPLDPKSVTFINF